MQIAGRGRVLLTASLCQPIVPKSVNGQGNSSIHLRKTWRVFPRDFSRHAKTEREISQARPSRTTLTLGMMYRTRMINDCTYRVRTIKMVEAFGKLVLIGLEWR